MTEGKGTIIANLLNNHGGHISRAACRALMEATYDAAIEAAANKYAFMEDVANGIRSLKGEKRDDRG